MAVYSEKKTIENLEMYKHIKGFEDIEDRIYIRLFNKENLPFDCSLDDVPHKVILDCAMTYCIQEKAYIHHEKGVNCYLIKNTDLEQWNITADELHSIAYQNTRQNDNARVETLQKHIARFHVLSPINEVAQDLGFTCDVSPSSSKDLRHTLFENNQYGQMPFQSNINLTRFIQGNPNKKENENLLIISNRTMNFGAVNMFFNDVLDKVYGIFKEDFYLLPISIHDVLCVKRSFADRDNDNYRETEEDLLDMVEQINDQILSKTFDILSYNIYLFLAEDQRLMMIK